MAGRVEIVCVSKAQIKDATREGEEEQTAKRARRECGGRKCSSEQRGCKSKAQGEETGQTLELALHLSRPALADMDAPHLNCQRGTQGEMREASLASDPRPRTSGMSHDHG